MNKNSSNQTDYLIINFWDSTFNYGAMLTAYAMQEMVKDFGFNAKLLNTGEKVQYSWYRGSHLEDFSSKYLNTTNPLSYKETIEFAKKLKGVIIGSDQVLRLAMIRGFFNKYLVNFAGDDVQKIAFSPSFGLDKKEFLSKQKIKQDELEFMKNSLKSFDYLSCRELQGLEIYKDLFDLDADMLLDPVFLIDKEKYVEIAKTSSLDVDGKIFSYILRENEYRNAYSFLSEKLNAEILEIDVKVNPTQDWLNGIINSKFVITDSFHCACFAIIFNKPFICVSSEDGGASRLYSLFEILGINGTFVTKLDELYSLNYPIDIDYKKVNIALNEQRNRCLDIVQKVLKENYSNNPNKISTPNPYKYSMVKYFSKYFKYVKCMFLAKVLKSKPVSNIEKAKFRKIELEWN